MATVDPKEITKDMATSVIEVLYENDEGKRRLVKMTLQPGYIKTDPPTPEQRQQIAEFMNRNSPEAPSPVIFGYAIEENAWRAFRADKVFSCQITSW